MLGMGKGARVSDSALGWPAVPAYDCRSRPREVDRCTSPRFASQRFGNDMVSVGVAVGHAAVRREAFDGVTLVVQQRAWPVDRRINHAAYLAN